MLDFWQLCGCVPVERRQFQQPVLRPGWQEAEDVAEVGPRLDVVHPAAGEQRDEGGVGEGAVGAADEEPGFPIMESSP